MTIVVLLGSLQLAAPVKPIRSGIEFSCPACWAILESENCDKATPHLQRNLDRTDEVMLFPGWLIDCPNCAFPDIFINYARALSADDNEKKVRRLLHSMGTILTLRSIRKVNIFEQEVVATPPLGHSA